MPGGSNGRVRRLILVLSAVAGAVAAHGLGYTAAHLDPVGRSHHLHVTGHGYWPGAVRVAIAGAVLAMGFAGGAGMRRALDRSCGGQGGSVVVRLAPLAAVQLGLFGAMEVLERVVAGADLSELVRTPWFATGLALQVLVAAVAVVVLRLLDAGGERMVACRGHRPGARPTPVMRPPAGPSMPPWSGAPVAGCRGPPAAASLIA